MQNSDKDEFNTWLKDRLKEVDLSPGELAQFMQWLDERTHAEEAEHRKFIEKERAVSSKEFLELFLWLKNRFNEQRTKS